MAVEGVGLAIAGRQLVASLVSPDHRAAQDLLCDQGVQLQARILLITHAGQTGETAVLRFEVTDNIPENPTFEDPVDADTATITITGPDDIEAETDTDITPSVALGIYHFNFQTAGEPIGDWISEVTFTLGGLITIRRLEFTIEAAV